MMPWPAAAKNAVKTGKKKAVAAWYKNVRALLNKNDRPSIARGCRVAAVPTKALRKHTRATINLMRRMVGVKTIKLKPLFNKRAQQAALITTLNGLNHDPDKSALCWTKMGKTGAGNSNLSLGSVGAGAVTGYMDDSSNVQGANVGHRSWLIDPFTRYMGVGQVDASGYGWGGGAIYVVNPKSATKNPNPQWLRWPTAGFFPKAMEPSGLWSFMTAQPGYDLSKAKATIKKGTKALKLATLYDSGHGGQSGIIMQVRVPRTRTYQAKAGAYSVTITGIRYRGVKQSPVTYKVKLF